MIQVAKGPDGAFAAKELFKTAECNSQLNPALLYKGHLYANSNSNTARDGLVCLDLTGKVLWRTGQSPTFELGHMILADGMINAYPVACQIFMRPGEPTSRNTTPGRSVLRRVRPSRAPN